MLLDRPYGRAVDWWSFGVLLYQMMTSQSPFRGQDQEHIYNAILTEDPPYPKHLPGDAVDLIRRLLIRKPEERLGYKKGAEEIMDHEFFNSINWDALYKNEVTPPLRPTFQDREDLSNFESEITSMAPCLTLVQSGSLPRSISQYGDVDKGLSQS